MMHLSCLAGLGQCIRLVYQQDDGPARLSSATALELLRLLARVVESGGQQLSHLADTPLAARREAQWKQSYLDVLLARDGVTDRFGECRLA